MRNQVDYNKVVDFDTDSREITVLDYTFEDVSFKGATGSKFQIVSKEEFEEATEKENVIENLIDSGIELPQYFKRGGFAEMYEVMEANDEVKNFVFDTSYSELWDYLREELNLSMEEAYIFNCVGGGRCFDKDFQGNINIELSEVIRQIES